MNVTKELLDWVKAKKLPYWEQYALDLIIRGEQIEPTDIEYMGECLLEDAGVTKNKNERIKLEGLQKAVTLEGKKTSEKIFLASITGTQNINALIDGQQLDFSDHLTIIYGANGTGKSGYGRLFGNACFTRGDKEILHNITDPKASKTAKQAVFHLKTKAGPVKLPFNVDDDHPMLQQFYVHDTKSISAHLTQENEFKFSPLGLEYLTSLAEVCDQVGSYVQSSIDNWNQENDFSDKFAGNSDVRAKIAALSSKTDLDGLEKLGKLTEADEQKIDRLKKEIARFRSLNIPAEVRKKTLAIRDLQNSVTKINALAQTLGTQSRKEIQKLIDDFNAAKTRSELVGATSFKNELFPQIGSGSWQEFIHQAHALTHEEDRTIYPKQGDHCLLCHQELQENAIKLFERYWNFLNDDSKQNMQSCEQQLKGVHRKIGQLDIGFFDENSSVYQLLEAEHESEQKLVASFVANAKGFQTQILKSITDKSPVTTVPMRSVPTPQLQPIIEALTAQLDGLNKADPQKEIETREAELRNFEHRQIVGKHLKQIRQFVLNRQMAEKALKVKPTTNHISVFQKALFGDLVAKKYVGLFKDNLRELGRPLPVEIKTSNTKGTPLKQLVVYKGEYAATRILSEGEKRIASLADFLTEVALDESSCGIVLDDPVTSLDIEWKEDVAKRLVSEAETRQTIIFTHDLHFVFLLREFADSLGLDTMVHWIYKQDESSRPGQIYLNNSPASEKDYKSDKFAKMHLEDAKTADPQSQEHSLKAGFAALRTSYEALIIYDLFGGVVERFQERTRPNILERVVLDKCVFIRVRDKIGSLSRFMEGHLHSDDFGGKKPGLELLKNEIEEFNKLKKEIKDLKTAETVAA